MIVGQAYRYLEVAELFDRLLQVDLAAIDLEVLRRQRFHDVLGRYRPEQLVVFARLLHDRHAHAVHQLGQVFRLALLLGFLA
jgi:hypothetical protein